MNAVVPDIGADKIPSHLAAAKLAIIQDASNKTPRPSPRKQMEEYNEFDEEEVPRSASRQNIALQADPLSKILSLKSVAITKDEPELANACLEWLYEVFKNEKVKVSLTLAIGVSITVQALSVVEDTSIDSVTLFVAKNNDLSLNIPQAMQLKLAWADKELDCMYMGRLQPGEKFPFHLMTFLIQSPQ